MSCPRVQLRVAGGWLVRYSAYIPCSSPGYVAAAGAGGQAGQAAPSVAPGHRQVRASPPSVLDKFVSCPQLAGVSSPTALVSPSDRIFKHAPLWHFLGQKLGTGLNLHPQRNCRRVSTLQCRTSSASLQSESSFRLQ